MRSGPLMSLLPDASFGRPYTSTSTSRAMWCHHLTSPHSVVCAIMPLLSSFLKYACANTNRAMCRHRHLSPLHETFHRLCCNRRENKLRPESLPSSGHGPPPRKTRFYEGYRTTVRHCEKCFLSIHDPPLWEVDAKFCVNTPYDIRWIDLTW